MVAVNCKTIYSQNVVCFRCIIVNNVHKFVVVDDDNSKVVVVVVVVTMYRNKKYPES
jgi:hypothetical protein